MLGIQIIRVPSRNWTHDLPDTSRTLKPLSYGQLIFMLLNTLAKLNSSLCSQQSSTSAVCDLWGDLQGLCSVSRFIALHVVLSADLCGVKEQLSLAYHWRFLTLSSLLFLHLAVRLSILSGKFFPLNYFSVMVPVSGRQMGGSCIPGLPGISPCSKP